MWTWDNVYADQFANTLCCCCASVGCCLNSANIAADHDSNETAADKFLADEGNIGQSPKA